MGAGQRLWGGNKGNTSSFILTSSHRGGSPQRAPASRGTCLSVRKHFSGSLVLRLIQYSLSWQERGRGRSKRRGIHSDLVFPFRKRDLTNYLEVKSSVGAQDKAEIGSQDQTKQLRNVGQSLCRNLAGGRSQDLWLLLSRLSRMAFRARDNNPSTDLGERPII